MCTGPVWGKMLEFASYCESCYKYQEGKLAARASSVIGTNHTLLFRHVKRTCNVCPNQSHL